MTRPPRAKANRTGNRELYELVASHFRVLGEPARLELLHALGDGERSAADLLEDTDMAQASLSKHMAALCAAGFVRRRREGTFVHYALADRRVLALCDLMCGRIEAAAARRYETLAAR